MYGLFPVCTLMLKENWSPKLITLFLKIGEKNLFIEDFSVFKLVLDLKTVNFRCKHCDSVSAVILKDL